MVEHTKDTIIDTLNANNASMEFMGKAENAKLGQQQTMHQVFKVNAENGNFYVKLGKPQEKDKGAREMKTETEWYNRISDNFGIECAPKAAYIELPHETFALAVEKVIGETYDQLLIKASTIDGKMKCLGEIFAASVDVSTKGYRMHLADKEGTPAYFGEFDVNECNFLNSRTLKILRASLKMEASEPIASLEAALNYIKPLVTEENQRSFYRDAIPLNWIKAEKTGMPVPIDLGSTSYRPIQFELVALIETPKCGLDELTESQRHLLVGAYSAYNAVLGNSAPLEQFETLFAMASYLKNASGVASRIQHIKTNSENIIKGADAELNQKRLAGNIEGRDFHICRALASNTRLLECAGLPSEIAPAFEATRKFFEELKEGKYL